jgi:two-component system, NtrC family, C4-dicarboxylate transport response regulator DctD
MATVLVVDDDPSIRLLCRINLELDGHEVLEAGTLGDARAILDAHDVGVVLLDLRVGHESGTGLLGDLHARQPRIPVAVVSGSAELEGADRSLAAAMLRKPFTIDQLLATVRRLVSE